MHNSRYNEEQSAALHHFNGPALVIAGPGSGKTTTLTGRIAFLIQEKHILPSQILVITYTKEAAASMQKRFLSENPDGGPVTFGTFHAIFYHILKTEYSLQAHCLLSAQEKKFYLFPILKKLHIDRDFFEEILQDIALRKNGENAADRLSVALTEENREEVFREYTKAIRSAGRIDFEDMLLLTLKLFRDRKDILHKWQERFRYILVDEFQDTNRIQYELLRLLAAPHRSVFAVGDDDQSIYGFRGATPAVLRRFLADYPEAEKYYLKNNYRSDDNIVHFADRVISQNKDRLEKKPVAMGESGGEIRILSFAENRDEYRYFVGRIPELKQQSSKLSWRDFAILCRTNQEAENIKALLSSEGIPCTGKAESRKDETYRDILAYKKLAAGNGSRQDFLRIMNRPDRGLDRGCLREETVDFRAMVNRYREIGDPEGAEKLVNLHRQLQKLATLPDFLSLSYIRKSMGYDRYVRKRPDREACMEKLDRWQKETERGIPLEGITEQAYGTDRTAGSKTKDDVVQILTMHASKGLEFYYVGIPNVQEGRIPYGKMLSEKQEEEERRLFYVAVSRAKKILDILYVKGTKERPGLPSRFLPKEAVKE